MLGGGREVSEVKLLPCPFCGGKAKIYVAPETDSAHYCCVECTLCKASTHKHIDYLTDTAVSEWNKRAPLQAEETQCLNP